MESIFSQPLFFYNRVWSNTCVITFSPLVWKDDGLFEQLFEHDFAPELLHVDDTRNNLIINNMREVRRKFDE